MTRPFVTLCAVLSADGYVARDGADNISWASLEDKQQLYSFSRNVDAIYLTSNTYQHMAASPLRQDSKVPMVVCTRQKDIALDEKDVCAYWDKQAIMQSWQDGGYQTIALFGGPRLYRYFYDNNWIDAYRLTHEQVILGGGLSLFGHDVCDKQPTQLVLKDSNILNAKGTTLNVYS